MMLINADNVLDAHEAIKKNLGNLNDYEIVGVNITPILEVCPYIPENELLKKGNFKPVSEAVLNNEQ